MLIGVFALIIILGGYLAWQYLSAPSEDPPEIPTTSLLSTYEFTMNDMNGTSFSLTNYRGKVILLHLMAVGCSGQIYQINDYQLTQLKTVCDSYCGKDNVTIISVAVATCENSGLSWIRETYDVNWFFGNDVDDGTIDIAQNYGVYGDGTIVIIDKNFQVHEAYSAIDATTLKSEINQLLET